MTETTLDAAIKLILEAGGWEVSTINSACGCPPKKIRKKIESTKCGKCRKKQDDQCFWATRNPDLRNSTDAIFEIWDILFEGQRHWVAFYPPGVTVGFYPHQDNNSHKALLNIETKHALGEGKTHQEAAIRATEAYLRGK
jgi:hypothetical protein